MQASDQLLKARTQAAMSEARASQAVSQAKAYAAAARRQADVAVAAGKSAAGGDSSGSSQRPLAQQIENTASELSASTHQGSKDAENDVNLYSEVGSDHSSGAGFIRRRLDNLKRLGSTVVRLVAEPPKQLLRGTAHAVSGGVNKIGSVLSSARVTSAADAVAASAGDGGTGGTVGQGGGLASDS